MTNAVAMPVGKIEAKANRKITFQLIDLPYIFIAGGFIGTVYEFLLTLITKGLLEDHSGSVLTPFNYVYGIGAVLMFLALYRMKNPIIIFAVGSLLGGIVEFGLSLGQELLFGTVSWDYSQKLLNIGGRTTIPYMLVWGALCLIAIKLVFPTLLKLIHKIPERARKVGAVIIVCLMCVDAVLSASAVLRYSSRTSAVMSDHPVIQLIDRIFDNDYMTVHYPHMILK